MTYEEIIDNVRDLGFSDDAEIEEFGELVPNAVERAVTEINIAVPGAAPRNEHYDFYVGEADKDLIYIDMEDVDNRFMEFAETDMLYKKAVLTDEERAELDELRQKEADGTATEDELIRLAELEEEYRKGVFVKFTDFEIMNESTIILDQTNYRGDFRVIYKRSHERFTGAESQLSQEVPLNRKVHHIVAFLAAYYVWLEDEPTKAAQYYNMYEQKVAEIKAEALNKKPRIRIIPGGI